MTDGKMICQSISADKNTSAVRLIKAAAFQDDKEKIVCDVVIEIKFSNAQDGKKYDPGKTYNVVITEEE